MKLTNGQEVVILNDEVQIKAFKNNGWTEVVAAPRKRKNEDNNKD